MGLAALIAWLSTAGFGLYLLAVWLIEYDREFQTSAKTRLPIPVISSHALLALAGVTVWAIYLLTDSSVLAWAALAILGGVAALGLTMAVRWLRGSREAAPALAARPAGISTIAAAGVGLLPVTGPGQPGSAPDPRTAAPAWSLAQAASVPPERNFPVPVVIGHGLLALVTVTLVAITVLQGH